MPVSDGGLRPLFRKHLPKIHWVTIESRYTQSGIPDFNGCIDGYEFWIECKATKHYQIKIRPMQSAWIQRRIRSGGNCYLAIRRNRDELWLVHGVAVKSWKGNLRELPISLIAGRWYGGPARWPWPAVLAGLRAGPPVAGLAGASLAGLASPAKAGKRAGRAVAGHLG